MFEWSDVVTIGLLVLLEGLLSADNALVLAVLVLGLPKDQQKKALRYGILGAFFFRAVATLLAVYLIELSWVKLPGPPTFSTCHTCISSEGKKGTTAARPSRREPCSGCRRSGPLSSRSS